MEVDEKGLTSIYWVTSMRRGFFPLPQNTIVMGVRQKAQMRNRNYLWVEFSISPTPFLGLDIGNFPKPVKCLADCLISSYHLLSFSCPHLLFSIFRPLPGTWPEWEMQLYRIHKVNLPIHFMCSLSRIFEVGRWGQVWGICTYEVRKMKSQQLKFFSNLVIKKGTRMKTHKSDSHSAFSQPHYLHSSVSSMCVVNWVLREQ